MAKLTGMKLLPIILGQTPSSASPLQLLTLLTLPSNEQLGKTPAEQKDEDEENMLCESCPPLPLEWNLEEPLPLQNRL